jgi:carbamoyl-phosphate synthase large subunit
MASRGMQVCRSREELLFHLTRTPNPIVQEYLVGVEYTCAVFCNKWNEITGYCMAKRDLYAGTTYRAELGWWPELLPYLESIAKAVKPRGPLNIQLKLTEKGPVAFELNARCSGSTCIRAHFGYNEPHMLIKHFVLGQAVWQPQYEYGYAMRYWNEVYLDEKPT